MAEKGAEVARAYVLIVPSLQGAQKTITDELVPGAETAGKEAGEKGGRHMREGFAKAAKLAAAATVTAMAGAVALIKQSLEAYAETEQLAGGIQKLFGDEAAAKVMENAAQAYKTAGMSANQYMQSVTGISAALLKSGVSAEEAAQLADDAMRAMADNANTFGTKTTEELAGVYSALARQSWAVLDQLNLGYGGTRAGMQALIADANAYAKATGRAADLSIDNFGDVVTAIGLIQEKIGIAETTVKEAEGTISGSLGMLQASWQNLVAGFGDPGADVETLVSQVMASLQSVANNIVPTVQRIARGITTALPSIVQQVAAMVPVVFPDVLAAVVTLATSLAEELPGILESLMTILTDNSDMLINAAITICAALVAAAPRLIEVLADAIPKILIGDDGQGGIIGELTKPENQEEFVLGAIKIATALVEAIPRIVKPLIDNAPDIVARLVSAFQTQESQDAFAEAGKELGRALWNGIKSLFPSDWWKALLPAGLGGIISGVQSAFSDSSTPAAAIDLGGYDGLAAQRAIGGDTYNIGTLSMNAPSTTAAAAVFASIRQAASMGGA